MTPPKIDRRETQVGMVRRYAAALLDVAASEIPNLGGLRIRHLSRGPFTIIETGPAEWHVGKEHWSLDIYQRGARVFAAQWHAPDPRNHFSDGLECAVFSRSDYGLWIQDFLRTSTPASPPITEAV